MLTACGRVGFGASSDGDGAIDTSAACTLTAHDEDLDGIDDGCDVCPHIPDPAQADQDGDRVGDACDPEPTLPRQRIVLFDPFTTFDPAWMHFNDEHVTGDQLVLPGSGGGRLAVRPWQPAHDLFQIHGTTGAQTGVESQVALFVGQLFGNATYYCELYDTGTNKLQLTYTYDGSVFQQSGPIVLAANHVEKGTGTFVFETSATTSRCATTWHDEPLETSGPTPPGIPTEAFELFAGGMDTQIDYVIAIRTE